MVKNENWGGEPRLGIDIGRVIIDGSSHPMGGDTAFFNGDEATMLATPAMGGAYESIARLVELLDRKVWLVSKCGPKVEERTKRWLAANRFFEETGVPAGNLRFCRRRQDKRIHCARHQLTHFIDDRRDVHVAIAPVTPHRFIFGVGPEVGSGLNLDGVAQPVANWAEAEQAVVATLANYRAAG